MSYHKADRGGYVVRWRDTAGRQHKKTVPLWQDAVALDGEMKRKKAMGELVAYERGKITLNDFWEVWWTNYALTNLSPRTRDNYSRLWKKHIATSLGRSSLRSLSSETASSWLASLSATLKPSSIRNCLAVLQSVLSRAVEWEYIPMSPAARIKKPRLSTRRGRALTPAQVRALAAELDHRSAPIVTTLAWTGLRPGELRALRWDDFSEDLIRVERAVSMNEIGPTKTNRRRSVELRDEPRQALLEWYVACGQPAPEALVFPAVDRRGVWTDQGWRMWQRQVFRPAAERAGLKDVVPYDLRHTFASLLISEGRDVVRVAAQLGHAPTMTLNTYAHEFEAAPFERPANFDAARIFKARRGI